MRENALTLSRHRKQNGIQRFIWKDLSDQEVAQCTLNLCFRFFFSILWMSIAAVAAARQDVV